MEKPQFLGHISATMDQKKFSSVQIKDLYVRNIFSQQKFFWKWLPGEELDIEVKGVILAEAFTVHALRVSL